MTIDLLDRALASHRGWTETLCQLSLDVLPRASGSAVSVYDDAGVARAVAAADDRSLEIEQVQQMTGEGPGSAARASGRPVFVEDLTRESDRWPGYVDAIRPYDVGVVWSLPVVAEGTVCGSFTLYHDTGTVPEYLSWPDAVTLAGLVAATMTIDEDLGGDDQPTDAGDLHDVELASGVLAVRADVGVDDALALLRAYAFRTGRRISDVAADVSAGLVDLR